MRAVLPAEADDAVFHHLQPFARQPTGIALVERRYDLLLQDLIQTEGIVLVLKFGIRAVTGVADGKSVAAVPCFGPPAIECGAVEDSVDRCFLATGARSFLRASGRIQPHIDSLHKLSCQIDGVVSEDDNAPAEWWLSSQLPDALQDEFTLFVCRVGFSGKEQLYGSVGILQQSGEQIEVSEDQVRAFIGGKTPCEADGERLRVEGLAAGALGDIVQQSLSQAAVSLPEFLVIKLL